MGNWRTVNIIGTCSDQDLPALQKAVDVGKDWEKFHCLCYTGPSLAGLGMWAKTQINADGNLAERDFEVEDVASQLEKLVVIAPSLTIKVHCGDEWESPVCIATITVANGTVTVGAPEVERVDGLPEEQIELNLYKALLGR